MDGAEFKAVLRSLGKTQVKFANELGVALRTVHYWASKGPPSEIVYLLDLMAVHKNPSYSMADLENGEIKRIVKSELDRLLAMAGDLRRKELFEIVDEWFGENVALHDSDK
ncbi:hypothetical protein [Methylobacterium fujisawaense]